MAARKKIIETDDATDPHIETSDVEDASWTTYLQCDRAASIGGLVGVNEDNRAACRSRCSRRPRSRATRSLAARTASVGCPSPGSPSVRAASLPGVGGVRHRRAAGPFAVGAGDGRLVGQPWPGCGPLAPVPAGAICRRAGFPAGLRGDRRSGGGVYRRCGWAETERLPPAWGN